MNSQTLSLSSVQRGIEQVVLKSEGKVHSLTLRDVQLNEAGQIKLASKDFQTEAKLIVTGKMLFFSLL